MANLDLSKYGITDVKEVLHNPSYDVLFAEETKQIPRRAGMSTWRCTAGPSAAACATPGAPARSTCWAAISWASPPTRPATPPTPSGPTWAA